MDTNQLYVLTTYYNPMRFRRRRANYEYFRSQLHAPLITVELMYNSEPELEPSSADVLVQLSGDAVLWQKERLLNIALSHVPEGVKNIAWLDCDVVLHRADWVAAACDELEHSPLVQLFSEVYDLKRDERFCPLAASAVEPSGFSAASLVTTGKSTPEDFQPQSTKRVRRAAFGLAWAARTDLMRKHLFYDAMILGSGDRALACAAWGRYDDAIGMARLTPPRANHYRSWAVPFHIATAGKVGCVEGKLFHLWHGDLSDRRYIERHCRLAEFPFDPTRDIYIAANGAWAWSPNTKPLRAYVYEYFLGRNEDGDPSAHARP
jgi:hypothetical protein